MAQLTQSIANGTNTAFSFNFNVAQGGLVNVYRTAPNTPANEENDLVDPSDYTLSYDAQEGLTSGMVTFPTAPANQSIITITPVANGAVSIDFTAGTNLNAANLNTAFEEQQVPIDFSFSINEDRTPRYNVNVDARDINYNSLLPALPAQAFWRRNNIATGAPGAAIIAQNYGQFVSEVASDVSSDPNFSAMDRTGENATFVPGSLVMQRTGANAQIPAGTAQGRVAHVTASGAIVSVPHAQSANLTYTPIPVISQPTVSNTVNPQGGPTTNTHDFTLTSLETLLGVRVAALVAQFEFASTTDISNQLLVTGSVALRAPYMSVLDVQDPTTAIRANLRTQSTGLFVTSAPVFVPQGATFRLNAYQASAGNAGAITVSIIGVLS